jgi:hypothetical protein
MNVDAHVTQLLELVQVEQYGIALLQRAQTFALVIYSVLVQMQLVGELRVKVGIQAVQVKLSLQFWQ